MAIEGEQARAVIDDNAVAAFAGLFFNFIELAFGFRAVLFTIAQAQNRTVTCGKDVYALLKFSKGADGEIGAFMGLFGTYAAGEILGTVLGGVNIDIFGHPAINAQRTAEREGELRQIRGTYGRGRERKQSSGQQRQACFEWKAHGPLCYSYPQHEA
jgi:hypothetical protein